MAELEMLWVTDNPVSCSGKNTIRKLRKDYWNIKPGDIITVKSTLHADSEPYLEEVLKVKAVAQGLGNVIVNAFAKGNISGVSPQQLMWKLKDIYGDITNEEMIAITFY